MDFTPQKILYPTSTTDFNNRRFLVWNYVGSISLRKEADFNYIDIDFADKGFHKPLILKDELNICMGVMNYKGALIASRFKE